MTTGGGGSAVEQPETRKEALLLGFIGMGNYRFGNRREIDGGPRRRATAREAAAAE